MENLQQRMSISSEFRRARRLRRAFLWVPDELPVIPEEPEDIRKMVTVSHMYPMILEDVKESIVLHNLKKSTNDGTANNPSPWQLSKTISGHLGCVMCVVVNPANQWFATGSSDGVVKIWDLESGALKLSFGAHNGPVRALAMSARYSFLYTCGDDGKAKCWNLDCQKSVTAYKGHTSAVRSIALHPLYNALATGGQDGRSLLFDVRTKDVMQSLDGHTAPVSKVLIPPSETQIITASHDTTVKLWDFIARRTMHTLRLHHTAVRDLVFDPKLNTLTSGAADSIKQWQLPDGYFIQTLRWSEANNNCFAMSPQGGLVSGSNRGTLDFWEQYRGKFRRHAASVESGSSIFSMTFDHFGSNLITTGADRNIKIYEKNTMKNVVPDSV